MKCIVSKTILTHVGVEKKVLQHHVSHQGGEKPPSLVRDTRLIWADVWPSEVRKAPPIDINLNHSFAPVMFNSHKRIGLWSQLITNGGLGVIIRSRPLYQPKRD